jgi:predicted transcriptional regulator
MSDEMREALVRRIAQANSGNVFSHEKAMAKINVRFVKR